MEKSYSFALQLLLTTILVVVIVKSGLANDIEIEITLSNPSLLYGGFQLDTSQSDGRSTDIHSIDCYCSYPKGARFHHTLGNKTIHKKTCWRGGFPVKKVSCSAQLGCFNLTVTNKTITSKWKNPPFFIQDCFWRRKNYPDWSKANECKEDIGVGNGCVCNTSMCNGNVATALYYFSLPFLIYLQSLVLLLLFTCNFPFYCSMIYSDKFKA